MANRVITFHYTLSDAEGRVLDSSEGIEPLAFIEGLGMMMPALEDALADLQPGQKKEVDVDADNAYGPYDATQVVQVPRDQMPPQEIQIGDLFAAEGDEHAQPYRVTEITDDHVTLDGNHPLAGIDLHFDVEVVEVREATAEELDHGHIHGPGGHHH
jgi:FKBP-type peptidyl-prolyl cis-trans isomerase SlyD